MNAKQAAALAKLQAAYANLIDTLNEDAQELVDQTHNFLSTCLEEMECYDPADFEEE